MTGYSCRQKDIKNLDQGEIHYSIEYIGDFTFPKELLPKNLVVSFKDDKVLFEMTGLANSGIVNLSNPEKEIFDTYFSLPPLKLYYPSAPGELYPGFKAMEGMVIKKTSRTTLICGLDCKNAEVSFPDDSNKIINIWYTNEIKIKNSNLLSPFNQVEGVLMSFFFLMGSSELHFEAESIYEKEISDDTFERKKSYDRVSRKNIERLIERMGG